MLDKLNIWSAGLLAVAGTVLAVGSVIDSRWILAGLFALLALYGVREVYKARMSSQVLADWPIERIRTVIGDADDTKEALRRLRAEDPRLSLLNAVDVVRRLEKNEPVQHGPERGAHRS